jgi:hypothetical protein
MEAKEVILEPTGTLANGWYVFSVRSLPDGVVPDLDTAPETSGVPHTLARFRVGSGPVLRDVRLTASGKLIVDFSEDMVIETSRVASLVTVTAPDDSACTLISIELPRPASQIGFKCSPAAWSGQRIRLSIAPGLVSVSGEPLGLLRERGCVASAIDKLFVRDVGFDTAKPCSSNCKQVSDFVERDTTPPSLVVDANPECLWPPNHKLVLYDFASGLNVTAKDECDAAPVVKIIALSSDQDAEGGGSGHPGADVFFGDRAMCLRAERAGTEPLGRKYTARLEAADAAGNTTTKEVTISVPHDQAGGSKCGKVDNARVVADDDPRCVGNLAP